MPQPLKRFPALQPISRQHHKVLQCCFKIRQGIAQEIEAERVLNYLRYFWEDYYLQHTKLQIDALNTLLTKDELDWLTKKENELVALYEELKPVAEQLVDFEKALYQHVRWEERVLFESIQDKFENAALKKLIPTKNDLDDWCELYQDQFWV